MKYSQIQLLRGSRTERFITSMRRTIVRSSGRYGVKKLKLKENPATPAGRIMQMGQKRAVVPSVPAIPVALLEPMGQEPYFLCQTINPMQTEKSAAVRTEESNSMLVGCGRGGPVNPKGLRSPSSQLKSRPVAADDRVVAIQNRPALRKEVSIITFLGDLHRYSGSHIRIRSYDRLLCLCSYRHCMRRNSGIPALKRCWQPLPATGQSSNRRLLL